MKILVVEDTLMHRNAAQKQLEGYELSIAEDFDSAMDLLIGRRQQSPTRFDVVLTDLLLPQGRGDMMGEEGSLMAYRPMGFGFPIVQIAALQGVPYIGVVTDMNHHDHPLAYTFDFLKIDRAVARIKVNDSTVMYFDERDLPGKFPLKEGDYTSENIWNPMAIHELEFPDRFEDYEQTPVEKDEHFTDGFSYTRKDETLLNPEDPYTTVKNWKAALERLLE